MEFNRYQTTATALGVKELVLPVLLFNAPTIFHAGSPDSLVREAEARQWHVIEDAVLSSSDSSEWKRAMAQLADRFALAYAQAESTLAELDGGELDPVSKAPATPTSGHHGSEEPAAPTQISDDEVDEDSSGLAEAMVSASERIEELTDSARDMAPAIARLGDAAKHSGDLGDSPSPQRLQSWSLNVAKQMREPSNQISEVGNRMFRATRSLDAEMQHIRRISVEQLSSSPNFALGYNNMIVPLAEVEQVGGQLDSLLGSLTPIESLSVALRKALKPTRNGLTRVKDSLAMIKSWQPIEISE